MTVICTAEGPLFRRCAVHGQPIYPNGLCAAGAGSGSNHWTYPTEWYRRDPPGIATPTAPPIQRAEPRNVDEHGNRFHHLKTWPAPWRDVEAGRKTFEFRRWDRDFRVGDVLVLEEYEPTRDVLTNRALERAVTYLLPGGTFGVPAGYCIMSLAPWPCPPRQGPRWTVSVYLVRDDHVLLVGHKTLNMWLPVGGGIEAGERPGEAVLREVREETGFRLHDIECLGFDEHTSGERIHMNLAYRANVLTEGDPRSDGSWDGHIWLRIGEEPPAGTPDNVRVSLQKLARPERPTQQTTLERLDDNTLLWVPGARGSVAKSTSTKLEHEQTELRTLRQLGDAVLDAIGMSSTAPGIMAIRAHPTGACVPKQQWDAMVEAHETWAETLLDKKNEG